MKIFVIGAGGVGGYFGGRICEAGFDTTFLLRGETLKAVKNNGLYVKSILGDFKVYPKVTDDYSKAEQADLIILCVKSWQIERIASKLKPFLKSTAIVLPLQNGADNAERLAKILNKENIIAGLCRIVSKIESPGIIDHFTYEPEVIFGEMNNTLSERVTRIKYIFDKAGFKNRISDQIQRDIWIKFLFITSISAMGALTRSVLGRMREDSYLREQLVLTAKEVVSVGQALQVPVDQKDIDKIFELIDELDYNTTMSLQRDIMEGKPSELENFNGYIVKQGDLMQIDTPVNDFIYYSLRPMELDVRREK